MATLPQTNGYVDTRSENWGYFVSLQELPHLVVELLDRKEVTPSWCQLQELPHLSLELIDMSPMGSNKPTFYAIMRGRNTGGGAAWVYWYAEGGADPTGRYYNGSVPFSQLADIIWASTMTP